jgi:hypothetical protein
MNKTLKIGILVTLVVYCFGILYTNYSNIKFNERVAVYDLDTNGIIDNKEIAKAPEVIALQIANRKTTKQAVIMLIPVSLLLGFLVGSLVYFLKKIKTINDNEINYNARK